MKELWDFVFLSANFSRYYHVASFGPEDIAPRQERRAPSETRSVSVFLSRIIVVLINIAWTNQEEKFLHRRQL